MTESLMNDVGYDDFPSGRYSVGPGEVFYIDAGRGPPVVMVHGSPTSSFVFRRQIARLTSRFRVIAPDLLWFGQSTGPPGGANFTTQAQAIRQLLDYLELGRFHLVVHDWGGPIGLGAAARRPEEIDHVVLLNTPVRDDYSPPWYWRPLVAPVLGELLIVRANAFGRGLPLFMRGARERAIRARYREPLRSRDLRRTILRLERLEGFAEECRLIQAALPQISEPKMVLWSEPDPFLGRRGLRRLRTLLPDAEVKRLRGGGHFAPEDAAGPVSDALLSFLER